MVGLGRPEVLALGAATGVPASSISLLATGSDGIRTATVSSPPVVPFGTLPLFGKISVSGPGQNASISFFPASGISRTRGSMSSFFAMWAMRGLSDGRPFAAYILRAASSFSASAPRPYTVSVGNATRPPFFRMAAASISSSSVVFTTFVFIIFSFLRNFPYYLWDDLAKCSYYPRDDSH